MTVPVTIKKFLIITIFYLIQNYDNSNNLAVGKIKDETAGIAKS